MIGQLFVLDQSCGAWYIEGINFKPGKPFTMTAKLISNEIIKGFVDSGLCHPAPKASAAAVPRTSAVAVAVMTPKPADKPVAKPDDKKGK
jgi:hypothetical protein